MSDGKGKYCQIHDGISCRPNRVDTGSGCSDDTSEYFSEKQRMNLQQRVRQVGVWLVHFVLVTASVTFFVLGCHLRASPSTKLEQALHTSTFSPLLKDVGEITETIKFNGTFDMPSIYRGYPDASLDAAWKRITKVGPFAITGDDVTQMGKSARECAQLPDDLGGGYMGTVEVFHQLHCLDMIRKYTYLEYYVEQNPKYWGDPMMRTHVDHCIEMLRQVLMCSSDLGIITYNFVEFRPEAWPDFNTIHQCRNFEEVLDWYHERELHATGTGSHFITKSAGSVVVATPP